MACRCGLDGVNINSHVDAGGCKELSFRCGFDANVALVLETGVGVEEVLGCLLGESCSLKSVWFLPWPSQEALAHFGSNGGPSPSFFFFLNFSGIM